jgi:hydrogenase-1 operon protein HyaF
MSASANTGRPPSLFNAKPILNEIRHSLDRLVGDGHTSIIDLQRIPFSAEDERYLRDALGDGEVHATINTLGKSAIQETGVAGVWWVTHFDEAGSVLGKFIEITTIPEVLKSQHQDMLRGLHKLRASLQSDQPTTTAQE